MNSDLPYYQSKIVTQKDKDSLLKEVKKQVEMLNEQAKNKVPFKQVKIRCPCCLQLISFIYAYRCLYCSLYFCTICAERHFGYRKPEPSYT
jgi:hypothetical protein